jgi:predicted cobalt transporter CbtA
VARSRNRGWRQCVVFLAVYAVALYVLLPSNPDAVQTPADILLTFRGLSAVGLCVFWAALGLTFGLLLQRQDTRVVAVRARPGVEV